MFKPEILTHEFSDNLNISYLQFIEFLLLLLLGLLLL